MGPFAVAWQTIWLAAGRATSRAGAVRRAPLKGLSCRARGSVLRGQRAQAIPLVALMLPLLLAVAGVALDGGIVFDARRELQNVADSAARAGATDVDLARFQQTGELALDTGSAVQVAAAYVADYNALLRPDQRVRLDEVSVPAPDRLVVRVSRDARTAFLRILGIASVRVDAGAAGTARSGGA